MELTELTPYGTMVSSIEEAYESGNMPALESLVLQLRHVAAASYVMCDSRVSRFVENMRERYGQYELAEELRLRSKLVTEAAPRIQGSIPVERTFRFVPLEAAAAGIDNSSKYCHVGSGPLPETVLAVRNFAPMAAITGVERDNTAMRLGREFIDATWPNGGIGLVTADGDDISYQGFTHVHVAALVRPEHRVVRCICETADAGVTIMLRTVDGLGGLLYQPISDQTRLILEEHGFKRTQIVRGETIMHTEIYRR